MNSNILLRTSEFYNKIQFLNKIQGAQSYKSLFQVLNKSDKRKQPGTVTNIKGFL